jgi:hypothetical protein
MSLERKIDQVLQVGDLKEQVNKLCSLADEILVSGSSAAVQGLKTLSDKILSDEVQQQVRPCEHFPRHYFYLINL